MSRTPWAAYLWPGLPQMCRTGRWSGLALAIGFALLLNLGLASSLLWCELVTPGVRNAVWTLILAAWGGALLFSSRADPLPQDVAQPHDGFSEAIGHYLKGDWFEAERILVGLLRHNPRDVDAGLMLATLLRHTGRLDEASQQLDRIERLEGSTKWQWEIGRERQRLGEVSEERARRAAEKAAPEPAQESETVNKAA